MATNDEDDVNTDLMRMDEEAQLIRPDTQTLSALNRSEVDAQLDAAHRYPRSVGTFVREATSIAITSQEVAKSCMYTLKRREKGKIKYIIGPSIRLAEIVASTYTNLHAAARPVDVDETTVTCQGICWDVQRNVRMISEVKRRITTSEGHRYSEDMIILTQNAASSIALRNAIFRVVPRALVDQIFVRVRQMAAGEGKSMPEKRKDIAAACQRMGVSVERMLAVVEREHLDDVTIEDIEVLIGLGTRVKDGEPVDEVFPQIMTATPIPGEVGKREPIKRPESAANAKPETKEPAPKPEVKSQPAGDDPDAADRAAAAPTQEEIEALEREKKTRKPAKGNPQTDEETPPWLKK